MNHQGVRKNVHCVVNVGLRKQLNLYKRGSSKRNGVARADAKMCTQKTRTDAKIIVSVTLTLNLV